MKNKSLVILVLFSSVFVTEAMNKELVQDSLQPLQIKESRETQTDQATIEQVSQEHVRKASQAYKSEIAHATPVQWAFGLSAAALVGYLGYKYYFPAKPTPAVQSLNERLTSYQELVLENAKNIALLAADKNLEMPKQNLAYRFTFSVLEAGIALANSGALSLGSAVILSPIVERLVRIKRNLPNSGNLQWYITDRTSYLRNVSDLMQASKHAVFRKTFNRVLTLLVADIENILGYLSFFKTGLLESETAALDRCKSYLSDIEFLANQLVDAANHGHDMALMETQLSELTDVVVSAQQFVSLLYR